MQSHEINKIFLVKVKTFKNAIQSTLDKYDERLRYNFLSGSNTKKLPLPVILSNPIFIQGAKGALLIELLSHDHPLSSSSDHLPTYSATKMRSMIYKILRQVDVDHFVIKLKTRRYIVTKLSQDDESLPEVVKNLVSIKNSKLTSVSSDHFNQVEYLYDKDQPLVKILPTNKPIKVKKSTLSLTLPRKTSPYWFTASSRQTGVSIKYSEPLSPVIQLSHAEEVYGFPTQLYNKPISLLASPMVSLRGLALHESKTKHPTTRKVDIIYRDDLHGNTYFGRVVGGICLALREYSQLADIKKVFIRMVIPTSPLSTSPLHDQLQNLHQDGTINRLNLLRFNECVLYALEKLYGVKNVPGYKVSIDIGLQYTKPLENAVNFANCPYIELTVR